MEEYLAIIKIFAGNFAPRGFALCHGQVLAIATNTALFSLLGTTYGGDGQTTFALPNLQGRVPVGAGQGLGLSIYDLGEASGTENTTLTIINMPIHNHTAVFTPTGGGSGSAVTLMASNKEATQSIPGTAGANTLAAPYYPDAPGAVNGYVNDSAPTIPLVGISGGGGGITGGSVTVGVSGGSQPFSILQPYLAVNYIICTEGIFPSRN